VKQFLIGPALRTSRPEWDWGCGPPKLKEQLYVFDNIWIQTIGQDNDWLERCAAEDADATIGPR
jgi:hypothetical protein